MKKHWKEEIQDLKSGTKFHKLFIPIIIFFYGEISGQISINGFCKFESFNVSAGFSKIYSLNFNGDSYSDILLFSPKQKKFDLLPGLPKVQFEKSLSSVSSSPFSAIDNFVSTQKSKNGFLFISRNTKRFGFFRLNKSGKILQTSSITLKSSPDKLIVEDFDNDGVYEALIGGISYAGLTIMKEKNGRFVEHSFATQNTYSEVTSFFINSDEFLDLAAFDPMNNELHFYFNDGKGNFKLARKIDMLRNISNLHSFDFNLDGFLDLIYEQSENIVVQFGDAENSFSTQKKILTKNKPDKFIYGDFNRDGLIDFAYLNLNLSSLFILFQQDENVFSEEMMLLKKNSLTDLIPFYSRFIDGILSLSSDGKLYLISRLTRFGDETKTIFASDDPAIDFFDYTKNNTPDIAILDRANSKIKLIIRNDAGVPALYFEIPTFEKFSRMIVYDEQPLHKTIFLYNRNKKVIQVIEADLEKFNVARSFIYSDGGISDLKLKYQENNFPQLIVSVKINRAQFISSYVKVDGRYQRTKLSRIDEDISRFFFAGEEKFFYWKETGNESALYFRENIFASSIKLYSYNDAQTKRYFSEYLKSDFSGSIFSYFIAGDLKYFLIRNENAQNVVRNSIVDATTPEKKFMLKSVTTFSQAVNKIYLYLPHENSLHTFELRNRLNKIIATKLAEFQTDKDFSIQPMTLKDRFVLYFDRSDNHLTLARLK